MEYRGRILILVLAAASCRDTAGPAGNGNYVRARINNEVWASDAGAVQAGAVRAGPGLYTISALRLSGAPGYGLVFSLFNIGAPGTYPLGVTPQVFGGAVTVTLAAGGAWSTPLNGAAGHITLTTLADARMAGTFAFTATPISGQGTLTVTDGEFDLAVLTQGTVGPLPDNAGSRLSATIAGGAFNAAAAGVILATGADPVLTVTANNSERIIAISITGMTGVGPYTLSPDAPVRFVQVNGTAGNPMAAWGSQPAGGSGTVTITSITAARIAGSFSATLAPLGGGATGTFAVTGTFDMGRPAAEATAGPRP